MVACSRMYVCMNNAAVCMIVCMDGEHIWTRFYELLADNGNDNSAIFAAARVLEQFKTGFR